MEYLISLLAAVCFCAVFRKPLKKKNIWFYGAAVVIAAAALVVPDENIPVWVRQYVLALFRKGYLASALFVVVMWIGALPNGSRLMKALYPVRGELSVFAGILLLGHMGGCMLSLLTLAPDGAVRLRQILNIVFSLASLAVFLPLWITSFPGVRSRMGAAKWRRLQRWAYLFYALSYLHMMLTAVPHVLDGSISSLAAAGCYTAVYMLYVGFRLYKKRKNKLIVAAAILLLAGSLGTLGLSWVQNRRPIAEEPVIVDEEVSAVREVNGDSVWNDGQWTGEAMGYNGPIYVSVTVSGGWITEIDVLSCWDDEPYFSDARSGVIESILSAQSTWVDAVSGATTSSWGLMDAVQDALDKAEKQTE